MEIIDRTAHAPAEYRGRTRGLDEVDAVFLHQTGPRWRADDVRAHFLVLPEGGGQKNTPPLVRMRYGAGPHGNARGVNVEHAAHLPGRYQGGEGRWAQSGPRTRVEDIGPMVRASRALLRALKVELPALKYVAAHRTVQGGKSGCPGPDLWREVGEWAIVELGLVLLATAPGGKDLPRAWRQSPRIVGEGAPPDAPGGTEPGPSSPQCYTTSRPCHGPLSLCLDGLGGSVPAGGPVADAVPNPGGFSRAHFTHNPAKTAPDAGES